LSAIAVSVTPSASPATEVSLTGVTSSETTGCGATVTVIEASARAVPLIAVR
jgi:hypothetical protein